MYGGNAMFKFKSWFIKKESNDFGKLIDDVEARGGISIYAHPFYEWVEENISYINYRLIKAIISNIVPLGDDGRKYFEFVINKRQGFIREFMTLYSAIERKYKGNNLKSASYFRLYQLGYSGECFSGNSPADEVLSQNQIGHA